MDNRHGRNLPWKKLFKNIKALLNQYNNKIKRNIDEE
jgi:hypothetical protein